MNSSSALRREILRLAKLSNIGACIRTGQLSRLFNIPERQVRGTLAELADQRLIVVSAWDGRQLSRYHKWPSSRAFVESRTDGGQLTVHMPSEENGQAPPRARAATA